MHAAREAGERERDPVLSARMPIEGSICYCTLIALCCMQHALSASCVLCSTASQVQPGHTMRLCLFYWAPFQCLPATKECSVAPSPLPCPTPCCCGIWQLILAVPAPVWQLWQLAASEIDWELAIISGISDNLHCQLPPLLSGLISIVSCNWHLCDGRGRGGWGKAED